MMTVMFSAMIAAALLILFLLLLLLRQWRQRRQLQEQVEQLEEKLQKMEQKREQFAQELIVAEQASKEQNVPLPHNIPDRYRYILGMAQQGMAATQIARVLQLGEVEVAQIVRLLELKKRP